MKMCRQYAVKILATFDLDIFTEETRLHVFSPVNDCLLVVRVNYSITQINLHQRTVSSLYVQASCMRCSSITFV